MAAAFHPPDPSSVLASLGCKYIKYCARFTPGIDNGDCHLIGARVCKGCRLVKYCSKQCQESHWIVHRVSCQSPMAKNIWLPLYVLENRNPTWLDDKTYWGNIGWGSQPALDILKLKENEGNNWKKDLDLCFVDTGNIRSIISTVNGLPSTFGNKCTITISESIELACIKNVLVLLIFGLLPTEEAAEIALHVFYSARLPKSISELLKATLFDRLYPDIFCHVLKESANQGFPEKIFPGSFRLGPSANMKALFPWSVWLQMGHILDNHTTLEEAEEKRREVVMGVSQNDDRDRELHSLKPQHRLAREKFLEDGLVLPFGTYRGHFTEPNFFHIADELIPPEDPTQEPTRDVTWLLKSDSDPLLEWDTESVLKSGKENGVPNNDLYGALYIHVKTEFLKFAHQLTNLDLQIILTNNGDRKIVSTMLAEQIYTSKFDRIDITALSTFDLANVIPAIAMYGPFLKPIKSNKHASLIVFVSNYDEYLNQSRSQMKSDIHSLIGSMDVLGRRVYQDPDPSRLRNMENDPYLFRLHEIKLYLLKDWNAAFLRFERVAMLEALGKIGGIERKPKNTIVKMFPFMVDRGNSIPDIARQVIFMSLTRRLGGECNIEWRRKRSLKSKRPSARFLESSLKKPLEHAQVT